MDADLLHDTIRRALAAGADAAEAVGSSRRALSVSVRLGELEEVEREEARDLGLRVFVGQRQAVVAGSDISEAARGRMAERAVAMARLAPEDPYAGFAPADRLAKGPFPDLDLYDPSSPTPVELEEQAREAESFALATPGVTNSEGGSASWSEGDWRLVTSEGFEGAHRASDFSVSASAIAGEGAGMERGGEWRSVRHRADLPAASAIGADAGARAVARLGARKISSTTAAVVFENRLSSSLLGPLLSAISGPSVARGVSFLKDRLGQPVFAKGVRLCDDPHRLRGLGSAPFDDEGVLTEKRAVIDDGVLTTWLLNTSSARQLKMQTTGHASRGLAGAPGVAPHNLTLEPGGESPEALMAAAGKGLVVTSMFGPSINANTGDWSVGVSGFWFEDGALAYPVNEVTVAGNLIDIYARLVPASDLEIRGSTNAPSILVDGLAIAGK